MTAATATTRRKRFGWTIPARKARVHALLLATIAWAIDLGATAMPGAYLPTGQAKWTDFVHFYTLGTIARTGPIGLLYDEVGQHARQAMLLPAYAQDFFRPDTYPPLLALVFAPYSRLPYAMAGLAWAATTMVAYLACVLLIRRRSGPDSPLRDRGFVLRVALAFPPVWFLFLHGQTTILPFLSFACAWFALERRHAFLAGLAIGTIALKPQLGIAIAVAAMASAEWRIVAGAVTSVALQAAITVGLFGTAILRGYVDTAIVVAHTAHIAEVKPYLQHSLRVLATLAPTPLVPVLLVAASAVVLIAVCAVWRANGDWRVRMGTVIIGTVLVDPHLYVYDAILLVLAGLWLGDVVGFETWFWQRVYWMTVTLFVPTAAVIRVQLSVVLLSELLYQVWRRRTMLGAIGVLT